MGEEDASEVRCWKRVSEGQFSRDASDDAPPPAVYQYKWIYNDTI